MLEFGTLEAISACVSAGLGITMLLRGLMERTQSAGSVSLLKPPAGEAMVDTVFPRRRDSFTTSALREFLARATQAFAPDAGIRTDREPTVSESET